MFEWNTFDKIFWYSKETHPPNPFTPLSSSSSTSTSVWGWALIWTMPVTPSWKTATNQIQRFRSLPVPHPVPEAWGKILLMASAWSERWFCIALGLAHFHWCCAGAQRSMHWVWQVRLQFNPKNSTALLEGCGTEGSQNLRFCLGFSLKFHSNFA